METIMNFKNLLLSMGWCCLKRENFITFEELPVEVIITILGYLDTQSLVAVSRVNRRLFSICKSSRIFRTKIRREIRRERKQQLKRYADLIKIRVFHHGQRINGIFNLRNMRVVCFIPDLDPQPSRKKYL